MEAQSRRSDQLRGLGENLGKAWGVSEESGENLWKAWGKSGESLWKDGRPAAIGRLGIARPPAAFMSVLERDRFRR